MTYAQALKIYSLMTPIEAAGVRIRVDVAIREGGGAVTVENALAQAVRDEYARKPLP